MDFRISADDRVGNQPSRGQKPKAQPRASKGERVEPSIGGAPVIGQSMGFSVADERPSRGTRGSGGGGKPPKTPRRGKAKPAKKRSRSGGFLMGLLWWGFVACIWGGIAVIGVVVYYGAQLPSANTWAIPDRPPNIRILAADGSLISNRGATGGEAITVGSSRVDLQACKLEYSIVSPK